MGRPRSTIPTIRRRAYRHVTILRVWWRDRWHRVGTLGDVRGRVLALISAAPDGSHFGTPPLSIVP